MDLGIRGKKAIINVVEFINIKGIKARGNKLSSNKIKQVNLLKPLPFEEPLEKTIETDFIKEEEKKEQDGQITLEL